MFRRLYLAGGAGDSPGDSPAPPAQFSGVPADLSKWRSIRTYGGRAPSFVDPMETLGRVPAARDLARTARRPPAVRRPKNLSCRRIPRVGSDGGRGPATGMQRLFSGRRVGSGTRPET